tara:strand:+ start:44 stop:1435 length:1392 start_codon:yes stop_codon:yes gene_type:complete
MKNLFNIIGFQLGWWSCVLGVKHELIYMGPLIMLLFLLLHIQYITKNFSKDLILVLFGIMSGLVVDGFLKFTEIIKYQGDVQNALLAPIWILAMWAGFCITVNYSLKWLHKNIILQFLMGFVFGPLSYLAGQKMEVIEFIYNFQNIFIIAILWGFSVPLLFFISSKLNKNTTKDFITLIITVLIATIISIFSSINTLVFGGIPILLIFVIISFSVHWLIFIPSYIYKTEKYFDITGTITYVIIFGCTYFLTTKLSQGPMHIRSLITLIFITIWAIRLGIFLLIRVFNVGEDKRFREAKTSFSKFLAWFTTSGLWVFLTTCNALILIINNSPLNNDLFFYIGVTLWLLGFITEVLADDQKRRFKLDEKNKDKFISSGLWKISRHPNYFGEIIQWFAIALISLPVLIGWQYLTLISPIFVTLLITKFSGVSILEENADKKWNSDNSYIEYKKNTPILIPFIKTKN